MTVQPHPDFIQAGKITARVIKEVSKLIRPGVKVLKICTLAEKRIIEYGGRLAFPCNVSINNEAAHYSSPYGDRRVFPDKGLVKLDIGAHVNGHISDTAITVDLDGSLENYIIAANDALDAAIDAVYPGVQVGEIGKVIERSIKRHGLKPVHQLSGHQLKQWNLHAGKNVPNIGTRRSDKMMLGETFAIEPFATNGNGTIKNSREAYIFSNNMSNKKKLDRLTMQVRNTARRKFGSLPWASRWLYDGKTNIDAAIHNLVRAGAIHQYPVLLEGKDGLVSQAEHSIFVGERGAIVTTRMD